MGGVPLASVRRDSIIVRRPKHRFDLSHRVSTRGYEAEPAMLQPDPTAHVGSPQNPPSASVKSGRSAGRSANAGFGLWTTWVAGVAFFPALALVGVTRGGCGA